MYKYIFLLTFLLIASASYEQIINEELVRKELKGKNIDEEELQNRLEEKGVDTQQLSDLSPDEWLEYKEIVEETIAEMERESETPAPAPAVLPSPKADTTLSTPSNMPPSPHKITTGDTLKKELPIYGKSFFIGSIPLFERTDDANVPEHYILGTGDNITVSIWGISQLNRSYEINAKGYIHPNKMPRIYLKGMTLSEARRLLKNNFQRFYPFNEEEFEVTLNHIRSIPVHIYGEVEHPGGYNIPATNTALNALVAAGGPNQLGSIRNITLYRGQQKISIDLYKWLEDPAYANQLYLNENDVLHVPVANHIVEVIGAVYRPMKYEIRKEEQLSDLLHYAGGLKPNAYLDNINIARYENGIKTIKSIPWKQLQKEHRDIELKSGDQIEVKAIKEVDSEVVRIRGAIEYPGKYAWTPKTHIADILQKAKLLKSAKMELAYVLRIHPDSSSEMIKVSLSEALSNPNSKSNIVLSPNDEISILDMTKLTKDAYVLVQGAVYKPGKLAYDKSHNMRVSDAVLLANGLRDNAFQYAYIERRNPEDINSFTHIRVDIKEIMRQPGGENDLILYPYDQIIVEDNTRFKENLHYSIAGEVKTPGTYKYRKEMTIKDAILQSGGLKQSSDKVKVDIFRITTSEKRISVQINENYECIGSEEIKLQPQDYIVIRKTPHSYQHRIVYLQGEIRYPGEYALTSPNLKLSDVITQAGGLTQEAFPEGATLFRHKDSLGFVVVNLKEALSNPGSVSNVFLAEQDEIHIPKKKDLVTIEGATNASEVYFGGNIKKNNKISVPFLPGKNAKYYIDTYSAGISKRANKNDITVIDPNGKVRHLTYFLFFKKYPPVSKGSIIRVGYKPKKAKKVNDNDKTFNWEKVADNTLRQVTTILSLVILAKSASSL